MFTGIVFAQEFNSTIDNSLTNTTSNSKSLEVAPINTPDLVTLIDSVSSVRTGVFYNINDSKFQFINTVALYTYNEWLAFNVGYANEDTFATSITADVVQLSKWGVTIPVLKDVVGSVGVAGTFKRLTSSNEFAGGPVAQLKVKIAF